MQAGETTRAAVLASLAIVLLVAAGCRADPPRKGPAFPPTPTEPVPSEPSEPEPTTTEPEPEPTQTESPGEGASILEILGPPEPSSPDAPPFPTWTVRGPVTLGGGGDKFSAPGLVGDPDMKLVDGTWHLFVSIGDPAGRRGPNLHHTTSSSPAGPFTDTKSRSGRWPCVILDPRDSDARGFGDTYRCETISVEVLPDGSAVALYCGTPGPAGRTREAGNWFIYRATAPSIDARRWQRTGVCMQRDLPWEMGWMNKGRMQGKVAESGLFWHRGVLCSVYAVMNRRGWSLGLAASPDHGRSWIKKPAPIVRPRGGQSMVSHGNVAALSDGWYLLTYISGGRGGHNANGIAQAMTRDPWNGTWVQDPRNPVIRDVDVGIVGTAAGHVGSPSVEEDAANDRLVMHFHTKSENPPQVPGPRMRGRVLWAESPR